MPVRKYWTLGQITGKIKSDLDIEAEVFVRPAELIGYVNEAVDEAEAEIHSLYEDYFLTRQTYTLVVNQDEYSLPEDIYAHKIRRIIYNNGSQVYTIKRIQDWKKFEAQNISKNFSTSEIYQYFLLNNAIGDPKILLVPKSREAGSYMEIWYLRQANRLEESTDICDIPEFYNFIFQHIKTKIYEKEGHPNSVKADADLLRERERMVSVLTAMVPDAENEIEMDMSHYEESN